MAAQILSFAAARLREPATRDWSRQELAEFYRVESALLQAGLALESERGLSDEGEPWFVFCRADTGEVFIHFARVDGVYVVDGAAFGSPARGRDFGALVRDLIASHPLATTRRPGSNVMMHPAALLIALVGAAFFQSGKAKAAEAAHAAAGDGAAAGHDRRGLMFNAGDSAPSGEAPTAARFVALDAAEVAAVLTGVALGMRDLPAAAATPADTSAPAGVGRVASEPFRGVSTSADRMAAASDALSALPAADARTALMVMAVVHDLARSVAFAAAPVQPPASHGVAVDTSMRAEAAPAPTSTAPAAVSETPAPTLVVHLASGPSPQIEALAVVTADGVLTRIPLDHVVHVDQLPTLLADLIAHDNLVAAPAPTDPTPPDGSGGDSGVVIATNSDGHVAALQGGDVHHDSGSVTPAPADTSHSQPTPPQVIAPPIPIPTPAPLQAGANSSTLVPSGGAQSLFDQHVDAAVDAFVNAVPGVQVVISGHEVVFYDPAVLGVLPSGEGLDSVTWTMEDGSTVSLVGLVSELHAAHGVS